MTQTALPGLEKLTPRQRFALEVIRERGPLTSEELGAYLCERNLRHSHGQSCEWDRPNGNAMGKRLAKDGYVRKTKAGWAEVFADGSVARPTPEGYDPRSAEIPF